jgi:hypothetical protein
VEGEVTFDSAKEAVDFLASRVIAEAKEQTVTLSDEDKRLLYFSAVDPRTAFGISESRLQGDDGEFEERITDLLVKQHAYAAATDFGY